MAFPPTDSATFVLEDSDAPDRAKTPYSVGAGDYFVGNLDGPDNSDWIRLSVEAGETYRIELRSGDWNENPDDGGSSNLEASLGIIVPDRGWRATERMVQTVSDDVAYVTPEEDVDIFVNAYSYYGARRGRGDYTVSVDVAPAEETDLPDDTSTPARIGMSDYFSGTIEAGDDVDWIAVDLDAYTPVRFAVEGEGGLIDPALALYDPDGTRIAGDDDGGPGLDPVLVWTVTEAGTYYVAVSAATEGDAGGYTLSTEEEYDGGYRYYDPYFPTGMANDGNDSIIGSDDASDSFYGNGGDDVLKGWGGRDYLYGGDGDDTLLGGTGKDYLAGGDGDDSIEGGTLRDTLEGGDGDDLLFGENGRDRIDGGRGDDTVTGGAGVDGFMFGQFGGEDVITDFELGVDLLRLGSSFYAGGRLSVEDLFDRYGSVEDGNVVLRFKGGESVTIEGVDDMDALMEDTFRFNDSYFAYEPIPYY